MNLDNAILAHYEWNNKRKAAINEQRYDDVSKMAESASPFGAASLAMGVAANTLKCVAV